jgi:hypothetical protein
MFLALRLKRCFHVKLKRGVIMKKYFIAGMIVCISVLLPGIARADSTNSLQVCAGYIGTTIFNPAVGCFLSKQYNLALANSPTTVSGTPVQVSATIDSVGFASNQSENGLYWIKGVGHDTGSGLYNVTAEPGTIKRASATCTVVSATASTGTGSTATVLVAATADDLIIIKTYFNGLPADLSVAFICNGTT